MFVARRLASVAIAAKPVRAKHTLPKLPYEYDALEPVICQEIMQLHHCKHHQTYVNNLNAAEEKLQEAIKNCDVSATIALGAAIKFNGGGHINHSILWTNLTPCSTNMSSELIDAMECTFGSCDKFKERLCTMATGIQGSGWAWLGYDRTNKRLELATCANQDPLLATKGLVPLFGIDVWEHAYYLQYKNVRADYVKAIMEIANWKDISDRYQRASC